MHAPALTDTPTSEDALHETALHFARAALHWQRLSDDRRNWAAQGRRRAMAQAFLRYHSAKLALEDLAASA